MEAQSSYALNDTAVSGELPHLLGQAGRFLDEDLGSTDQVKPKLSAHEIHARWVKNDSGAAVLPGETVTWKTTAVGTTIGAKSAVNAKPAGVASPYLPTAGVADGEHFWIIQHGPCDVIHAGNDTIGSGDELVQAASGRMDKFDGSQTAANEANARIGRAMENPADTAGTKFRALVHHLG